MLKKTPMDAYIASFPAGIRKNLEALRRTILEAAPKAEEAICYGIPSFRQNGNLVHFAAFSRHIGFYPTSSGIDAFRKELAPYELSTGTVRFPIDGPMPLGLVKRIVRFRVRENMSRKA